MGGFIHAFKLPITGILLGGSAILCIAMMAWLVPYRGAIIRATIIVAIFKMMLSPQAPPPAYIAVFFQGACGELLYSGKRHFRLSSMILAVITLFESAIQRVIVLTVLMGEKFWKAVNIFISGITHSDPTTNYSLYIISVYIGIHLLTGVLLGIFMGKLPGWLSNLEAEKSKYLFTAETGENETTNKQERKKFPYIYLLWSILIVLYVQSLLNPERPWMSSHESVTFLVRSLLIFITWILLIAPLLIRLLKSFLEKQKEKHRKDIEEIMLLLPSAQLTLRRSVKESSCERGLKRLSLFWKMLVANTIYRP